MLFFYFYLVGSFLELSLVFLSANLHWASVDETQISGNQHRHLIFGVIHCVLFGSHRLDGANGSTERIGHT